jgi:hypothetical protein
MHAMEPNMLIAILVVGLVALGFIIQMDSRQEKIHKVLREISDKLGQERP